MSNITQILQRLSTGDQNAAADLTPLVYQQLRKSLSGSFLLWNLVTRQAAVISPTQRSRRNDSLSHPLGSTLYLGHRDGWVTSWRFPDATPGPVWSAFGDALTGFEVLGENRLLATSRSNASLRIRDFETQSNVAEFDLGIGYVSSFQLSRDRQYVSATGPDRKPVIGLVNSSPRMD